MDILLPMTNYPQFILNRYQEVGEKPTHNATPKNTVIEPNIYSRYRLIPFKSCENLTSISGNLGKREPVPLPVSKHQILYFSKPKEFADDNLKFDENDRKISKWVENTVVKGEIARHEQFLLFPQCF